MSLYLCKPLLVISILWSCLLNCDLTGVVVCVYQADKHAESSFKRKLSKREKKEQKKKDKEKLERGDDSEKDEVGLMYHCSICILVFIEVQWLCTD